MENTIVQVVADEETLVNALETLAPGWRDRTGIDCTRGWTAVPMTRASATAFAPMLADLLEQGILVWAVDSETCRLELVRPDGSTSGPIDARVPGDVEAFRKEFEKTYIMTSPDGDKKALTATAAAPETSPDGRHRAFAELLGVPYVEPRPPSKTNPVTPSLTPASASLGTREFRRRHRVVKARSALFYTSILTGLGFIGMLFQAAWQLSAAVLALTLVLLGVRLWLGLHLKRLDEARKDQG